MSKYSLSIRFSFFVFVLLAGGMLLIDAVLSGFWLHNALKEKQQHMRLLLQRISQQPDSAQLFNLSDKYCLFVLADNKLIGKDDCLQSAAVSRLALQAAEGRALPGPALWGGRLVETVKIPALSEQYPSQSQMAVLVERERTALQHLFLVQQYVIVYLLINAFVLAVVFFFRFTNQIARPLNRITEIADAYRGDPLAVFPPVERLGEIQQLSFNLQGMLRRLEHDRTALQITATELGRKNAQLLQNQQEMIRTEKLAATGRLAAGLAHEIGNPLGVVQGYLELLQMEDISPQERGEYCANALQETRRMHRLISTLLQTSRNKIESSDQLDINVIIHDYIETLRPHAMFKGVHLRLQLDAEPAWVFAQADAIRQVLLNALLNAVDAIHAAASGAGSIEVSTRRVSKSAQPWLDICITDTGCGLAPDHADKIFDPFFTTKEPGAGTGLGLSVSMALVESLGGSMYAENTASGGMALHILLPQQQASG